MSEEFFFCVFMGREELTRKKERANIQPSCEQAWSIKDLLYGIKHQNMINFPCGTKPESQAGKIAP